MKALKMLSYVLVVVGVLLIVYALLGRFIGERSVLGSLIPGGMSASTTMLGANTCLIVAILAELYQKKQ